MKTITEEQLDGLIKSAVNSSGPLPPDEKFMQIISALRELQEYRNSQQFVPDFGALTKLIVQRLVDCGGADDDAIARCEEFVYNACRAAMQSGAGLPPMQPMVIDSHGILRFKENPLVRKMLDVATAAGYGLNAMAMEDYSPDDRMQLAQLIGYSLSGYGDLSYVSDESYSRATAAPQQE